MHSSQRRTHDSPAVRAGRVLALMIALGALGACESGTAPAWVDPANWFREEPPEPTTEAAAATRERAGEAAAAAGEQPFPNLATVPDRPDAAPASVRERVAEGLVADRQNARYTADAAVRLGYVALPPQEVAARTSAPADGAPPIEVATIYFAADSTALQAGDEAVLRDIAALHEQLGGSLLLVGHASGGQSTLDALDEEAVNLDVSLERALAVAEKLAELGVAADRLAVEGRGDNQPQYFETAATGEAGNRRTVVYLLR